ncbi:MAG: hypothetical protein ACKVY0_15245 [Prosthecobacter sp.]|uniref:hypothetical protein n=1 Tax=Prosthecobacter sp. TaxID=1965333 RepID=UPI003900E91C
MNSSPFSLRTTFRPEDAGEDKFDLELNGWEVLELETHRETVHAFKQRMGGPPAGSEDFAWPANGQPPQNGRVFCRPGLKDFTNKLWIREEGITHKATNRRHEAPLCGGFCRFSKAAKPDLETGKPLFRAKLTLSLNLQRFIRHQPQGDDPRKPWAYRLQRRRKARIFHDNEQSLDGEDNWLPNSSEWIKFGAREHLAHYLALITKEMDADLGRACKYAEAKLRRPAPSCALSVVETMWEFPSDDPIGQTLEIGAKLMQLIQGKAVTKAYPYEVKETGRIHNAPSFSIPLAQGVKLRLYAKTTKRIRFEIVQSGLRKELKKLRDEALGISDLWQEVAAGGHWLSPAHCSPNELPMILKALRCRAAAHMNKVMDELRKGRTKPVKACSVVNLLAHVAVAVRAGLKSKPEQFKDIKSLLYMLCYQRGFRGSRKEGPMAEALQALETAGVLKFDRSRLFYSLTPPYTKAADALVSATGEPLLSIFGLERGEFKAEKAKTPMRRLRE